MLKSQGSHKNGFTSYIETENYFFSERICKEWSAHATARTGDNTHVIRSQSIKPIKKNWIFLLDQTSPSALSTRDLSRRLILTQFPAKFPARLYNSVSKTVLVSYLDLLSTAVLQWHGNPRVLGISISKNLVIWASPSHTTLVIWVRVGVRVRVTGDARITRCLGMEMPKTQGAHVTVTSASSTRDLVTRLKQSYSAISLPADVLWGSFVTHSSRTNPKGRLQGG